jgi:hypothetical protein
LVCFLLDDLRAGPYSVSLGYVSDLQLNQVTASQLAVYRQVEECQIAPLVLYV